MPGAALGATALWQGIVRAGLDTQRHRPRALGRDSKSSRLWCTHINYEVARGDVRLALGGEHTLTFPALEAWTQRHPDLRVIVFDAHHDSYPDPLLTHYTLFHFALEELRVPVLVIGARHELDEVDPRCQLWPSVRVLESQMEATLAAISEFAGDWPTYVSVDLDVLDPAELAGTGHAVPGGLSLDTLQQLVSHALHDTRCCAADIVEFNPLCTQDADGEIARLAPLFLEFVQWLG